jgi:hypothetical protein
MGRYRFDNERNVTMHMSAIVVVPADVDDVRKAVHELMEPHQEWWEPGEDGESGGWWDWYRIGGRWDGVIIGAARLDESTHYSDAWETLERNVVPVREMREQSFYRLVLPDGSTEARQHRNPEWDGVDYSVYMVDNPAFTELVGRGLVAYRDHLAVMVDYHS